LTGDLRDRRAAQPRRLLDQADQLDAIQANRRLAG